LGFAKNFITLKFFLVFKTLSASSSYSGAAITSRNIFTNSLAISFVTLRLNETIPPKIEVGSAW
jgi:hypothetical protein